MNPTLLHVLSFSVAMLVASIAVPDDAVDTSAIETKTSWQTDMGFQVEGKLADIRDEEMKFSRVRGSVRVDGKPFSSLTEDEKAKAKALILALDKKMAADEVAAAIRESRQKRLDDKDLEAMLIAAGGQKRLTYEVVVVRNDRNKDVTIPVKLLRLSEAEDKALRETFNRARIEAFNARLARMQAKPQAPRPTPQPASPKPSPQISNPSVNTYKFTVSKYDSQGHYMSFPETVQAKSESEARRILEGRHSSSANGRKPVITGGTLVK